MVQGDLVTFTQYGAIGYEIISKYSAFRECYIKYFKHKVRGSLNDTYKLDLMVSVFDLYLLLEGAIMKYKIMKENEEKDIIKRLNVLKIYVDDFNKNQGIPTAENFIKIKDIYAEFLMKIGVLDIFFKQKKKGLAPENALMGMEE